MREAELFDGTILEFPDRTSDEVIQRVAKEQTLKRREAAPPRTVLFEGRRIAVPQDATDDEIRDILNTPEREGSLNLSALGLKANAAIATNPEVVKRGTDAALATLTAAGSQAEPKGPGWGETIDRLAASGFRGVREGVASVLGLPVDIINNAPRLLNHPEIKQVTGREFGPISPKPIGGSASLDELLGLPGAAVGAAVNVAAGRPDAPVDMELEPRTRSERFVRRVGNELGGAAVPAGAAISIGGRMGAEAARNGGWFSRTFIEPAAVSPVNYARKEASAAAAAGGGAGLAAEGARAVGYEPGAGTELGGALAGLGVYGIGGAAIGAGKSLFDALVRPTGYTDQVVRDTVTGRLAQAMGATQNAQGVVDTDPLVAAITRSDNAAEARIPGFKASLADRTGNSQVAGLEYGRQSVDETGQFATRRSQNTAAIDAEMGKSEPQGNPGALRAELELERNRRLTDAEVMRLNAEDAARAAEQRLVPMNTAEGRGADIRAALTDAQGRVRSDVDALWAPINTAEVPVDPSGLTNRFTQRDESLPLNDRLRFRPPEADIPARLAGPQEPVDTGLLGPDGQPIIRPPAPPEPVPLREITALRGGLTDDIRQARAGGGFNDARVKQGYVRDVDAAVEEAIPPELAQQYQAARAGTRDLKDRFERPGTAIGEVLRRGEGDVPVVPDSSVPRKFVQPNEGRLQDFESLLREAGPDERVRNGIQDQIRADVRAAGLTADPAGLRTYAQRYGRVLNEYPEMRRALDEMAGARETATTTQAAERTLRTELGTSDTAGRSTVGQFLRFGNEKAENAMRGVLAAKQPREAAEELLSFVNDTPEAVEGGRRIFWDILQKDARAGGATTKTLDGAQPWNPARLKKFLDNPSNMAVAEVLYRDNPEHLKNIIEIKDAIQGVDVRNSAKAPNSSGTPQGEKSVLTPESLQSRFYAYARGQVGLPYLATSIAATLARNAIRKAQTGAYSRLLDEALLNPDVAAQLLKENNPANRAALARRAKTWAAPEVSNFITDDDDETMDAIRRRG
jgi:hypothetical protein